MYHTLASLLEGRGKKLCGQDASSFLVSLVRTCVDMNSPARSNSSLLLSQHIL